MRDRERGRKRAEWSRERERESEEEEESGWEDDGRAEGGKHGSRQTSEDSKGGNARQLEECVNEMG